MFSRLDEIMQKYKDGASMKAVESKFYIDFYEQKYFSNYLSDNWFQNDRIHKFTYNMVILNNFFKLSDLCDIDYSFFVVGMWTKCYKKSPYFNQEINLAIESYHCIMKNKFLC